MKNSIFQFIDIFEIKNGFYNKKPTESFKYTPIPFIGATAFNNGVTDNYNIATIRDSSKTGNENNTELENKIFSGNCITVTNNGSVGYAYYQPSSFTCSHDVNPLFLLTDDLNKDNALYLATSINQQRICFEYARKWRPKRMKKSKILLPVDSKDKPNYEYMETYIKDLRKKKEREYFEYILKRFNELKNIENPVNLEEKKWCSFYLSDLFSFSKGDQNNMFNTEIGDIPLVSAKKNDNAYKKFISYNGKKIHDGNSLTLNNDGDGGAGFSFYQPYDYLLDSHVTALYSNHSLSRFALLFISLCITLQKNKFGHGYSINNKRLEVFQIMLPINETDEPDFEYMEQYMKYLEYQKLSAYLNYKNII